MTIHLPPDVEKSLIAKVHSGMFPSLDAAMTQAAHLLLEQIEQAPPAKPKAKAKPAKTAKTVQKMKPLSPDELNRRLLASGLVSRLPDPAQDIDDDDDPPIVIKGEPLSETIIRERR
jgi:Arc/MetJ-type ribon-helix-helix transcriptional regulator